MLVICCVGMNLCGRQCKCSMNMTFVCWMIIIIVMQRDVKSSEYVVSSWYESKKAQPAQQAQLMNESSQRERLLQFKDEDDEEAIIENENKNIVTNLRTLYL